MYKEFFGLKESPFSIAPNPHYLYMSKQHHEALAHLVYGVGRDGGFVLLTGEVGTGKTTVCRCFLEQIPADTDVAFILNPRLNAEQMLETICDELSIPHIGDEISIKELVDCINLYLLRSHSAGRHTVLIVDEAQNLGFEVLEQLRLLTNLETHEKKLLQIVLLGQPELQEMFMQPELRQLAQRVTARFHLKELGLAEIGPYVRHRLGVAGGKDIIDIFPEKTLRKLHAITGGVPRVINLVCDRAMLGAYAQNQRKVDVPTLEKAAREVLGPSYPVSLPGPRWLNRLLMQKVKASWIAVPVVTALLGSLLWWAAQGLQVNISIASAAKPVVASPADENAASGRIHRDDPVSDGGDAESTSNGAPSGNDSELATAGASNPASSTNAGTSPGSVESVDTLPGNNSTTEPTAAGSDVIVAGTPDLDAWLAADTGDNGQEALRQLASLWGETLPQSGEACQTARKVRLVCFNRTGSLGYLQHLGLPAVLTLFDARGSKHFALLEAIDEAAVRLNIGGKSVQISHARLNALWRGQFSLFWRMPEHYAGPVTPGSISPMTRWIRHAVYLLDGKTVADEGSFYDDALVDSVKTFQRQMGETEDGIIGEMTLILLTRKIDATTPVLNRSANP